MSVQKIRIGTTIGDAFSFVFSRLVGILAIGWFPITITFAAIVGVAMYFFEPLIDVYLELFWAVLATGGALSPNVITPDQLEVLTKGMEAGFEEIGILNAVLGVVVITVISMLGYAIPSVAYCRMFVLEERVRTPLYFRLGRREIGFTLTNIVVMLLVSIVMIGFFVVNGLLIAGLTTISSVLAGLATFALVVISIGLMFWLSGKLYLAIPAAAIEGGIPIDRAWSLSSGNAWKIFWAIFLGSLVLALAVIPFSMFVQIVLGMIVGPLLAAGNTHDALITGGVITAIVSVIYYAFSFAYSMALLCGPYKILSKAQVGSENE